MKKLTTFYVFLIATVSQAQLKVGINPKVLSTNTVFEVEALNTSKFVISKDTIRVGIGTNVPKTTLDVIGK